MNLDSDQTTLRLDSFLSKSGFCARRKAGDFLADNIVEFEYVRLLEAGARVPVGASISINGRLVVLQTDFIYMVLNKPEGYLCASDDDRGRTPAVTLIPEAASRRLYNVGRLDYRSCGLIFFTDDGNFAKRVSHPSFVVEKEYRVTSNRPIAESILREFRQGVTVEGVLYALGAYRYERRHENTVYLTLTEGKNREIRRVFAHYGLPVIKLERVRIGVVSIGDLRPGESRMLTKPERDSFFDNIYPGH